MHLGVVGGGGGSMKGGGQVEGGGGWIEILNKLFLKNV